MQTLILCDQESMWYNDTDLRSHVQRSVQEANSEATVIVLNGKDIALCMACYKCHFQTPGLCINIKDDVNIISRQEFYADAVILLSKICYGGYSYDIKAFLDRSIPNTLPHVEIINHEMHYKVRWRVPVMIFIGYGAYSPQERQTFVGLAERNALNMQPLKHFIFTLQNTDETEGVMQSLRDAVKETESLNDKYSHCQRKPKTQGKHLGNA